MFLWGVTKKKLSPHLYVYIYVSKVHYVCIAMKVFNLKKKKKKKADHTKKVMCDSDTSSKLEKLSHLTAISFFLSS